MAWSEAARKAAAEARKRHAKMQSNSAAKFKGVDFRKHSAFANMTNSQVLSKVVATRNKAALIMRSGKAIGLSRTQAIQRTIRSMKVPTGEKKMKLPLIAQYALRKI